MSEDEIITKLYSLLHINTYINLCEQMELSVKIPKITLKKWKDNCNSLLDLYNKEKEKNKELEEKNFYLPAWVSKKYISKDKIRAKIEEINNRRIEDGQCELALHGFQREAKIDVLQELLEEE